MTASDTDVQLKVWKDLAISKQMLMNAAITALKLDKDCSQEELKQALETTISRAAEEKAQGEPGGERTRHQGHHHHPVRQAGKCGEEAEDLEKAEDGRV